MKKENIQKLISIYHYIGKYHPLSEAETQCVKGKLLTYIGDIPIFPAKISVVETAQNFTSEKSRYSLSYKLPRNSQEKVQNLIYTQQGMGWLKGKIYDKFSLWDAVTYIQHSPLNDDKNKISEIFDSISNINNLFSTPRTDELEKIPAGTIVESENLRTYGDWILDYLASLTSVPILPPLIIPEVINFKYVQHDLKKLGIEFRIIQTPVLIRDALVIRKTIPKHYVTSKEAQSYRDLAGINPSQPKPNSIIYLSRANVVSYAPKSGKNRSYPNALVAEIIQDLGGKIVYTDQTTYQEYCDLALEAETVIADHGGAMSNLLLWNTKNVIELFSNEWWSDCYLCLSKELGIKNYALLNIDDIDAAGIRMRIFKLLDFFNG